MKPSIGANAINKEIQETFQISDREDQSTNQVLQRVKNHLDKTIQKNYKLWPTNYIAYDLLSETDTYVDFYSSHDRKQFERRLRLRVDIKDTAAYESFLSMYAQPVINKEKLN